MLESIWRVMAESILSPRGFNIRECSRAMPLRAKEYCWSETRISSLMAGGSMDNSFL